MWIGAIVEQKVTGRNTYFLRVNCLCLNLVQERNWYVIFISWKYKVDVASGLHLLEQSVHPLNWCLHKI